MDFVSQDVFDDSSEKLFVVDGVAYNDFDAGNYLWGVAMNRLGFSYEFSRIGSELNGFFNGKSQNGGFGITLVGDSPRDQKAIRNGFKGKFGEKRERERFR